MTLMSFKSTVNKEFLGIDTMEHYSLFLTELLMGKRA
jgi:hypothetical protein